MSDDYTASAVAGALSVPRFAPYMQAAGDDDSVALRLYEWGSTMSAACFELVAHVEVLLRNAIDTALSNHYQDAARGIPWFLSHPPMNEDASRRISDVRNRLVPQGRDTRDQILAGLTFGFWAGMLGAKYEDLWRSAVRHAFPHGDGTRKQAAVLVEAVRKFRNRLAHHDSVLNLDIPFEVSRVHALAALINAHAAAWLRSVDRTPSIYAQRPVAPVDTVIVGGRGAWPLYEKTRAYICQPGRWFRPVERIAFYSDQEVKPDIAKITARRDHVPWTTEHATMLAVSQHREDRKIATVITESLEAGWNQGSYQVFLLSAPGDQNHRTLKAAIAHRERGRGSAFVKKQRYVSLHSLEVAATTHDL